MLGLLFAGFFLYFQVIKKPVASTASTAASTATVPPAPTTAETFNQQYNSYPTGGTSTTTTNSNNTTTTNSNNNNTTTAKTATKAAPKPAPKPASSARYITVTPWPSQNSTLSGIAKTAGKSLAQVEALNPQYKSNYNLIQAGQQVRVS